MAYTANFAVNAVYYSTMTKLSGSSSGKRRKSHKLTGTVSPAGPGRVTIAMSRLVGRKYKAAGTVKVDVVGGKFSYSFKPKYKGTWHFVVTYSGGVVGVTTYPSSKRGTKSIKVS
ncbi:MAG: hypothetical protein P4L93_00860 [Coriobacteriia bacterium]|nr:hypothetical protein [Coriobacteriia bacterium]